MKTIGLKESITLTTGAVIGVGLFTVGSNAVGILGSSVLIATFIALLISIYPAFIYGEMGASMPLAGGTYQFARLGLSPFWGMQAGWSFIISLIAVISGEALAFSFYFKTLLEALSMPLNIDDRFIAISAVVAVVVINWRGMHLSARIQNGLTFFFWGVALVWFLLMIPHLNWHHYNETISLGTSNATLNTWIMTTALVWWCFCGFETCCAMGSEIRHPQVNIPRALILAPFIVFLVTATFQWFLIGIVPLENLNNIAQASAPYAESMKLAGILGFPLILLCIGIAFGGNLSTLNPGVAAPARYLYSMAEDNLLPKIFAKTHPKFQSPYMAILLIGILTILLVSTDSIIFVASLSLFSNLFYYIIGLMAAIGLRKRFPQMLRPFKVKGLVFGAILSILIYLILMSQLEMQAFLSGLIWIMLGATIFYLRRKQYSQSYEFSIQVPSIPLSTQQQLDKQFKWWVIIVSVLFLISLFVFTLSIFKI